MTAFWGNYSAFAPALLGSGLAEVDLDLITWVSNDSALLIAFAGDVEGSKCPVTVPETQTAVGRPAIARLPDSTVCVAWSGTDGSSTLNIAQSPRTLAYLPVPFDRKVILWDRGAPAGPSIAWGNGRLYLAWVDAERRLQLGWSSDPFNRAEWTFLELPESAIDAPSISVDRTGVWIAWTGTDGNGTLNVASGFEPGSEDQYRKTVLDGSEGTFFGTTPTSFHGSDTSSAGPQIVVDDRNLALAYAGRNQNIYLLSSQHGEVSRFKCTATSDAGPAISPSFGCGIAWRGLDGGHTVNLSSTDPFTDLGAVLAN